MHEDVIQVFELSICKLEFVTKILISLLLTLNCLCYCNNKYKIKTNDARLCFTRMNGNYGKNQQSTVTFPRFVCCIQTIKRTGNTVRRTCQTSKEGVHRIRPTLGQLRIWSKLLCWLPVDFYQRHISSIFGRRTVILEQSSRANHRQ